jgi:hypothetical protein
MKNRNNYPEWFVNFVQKQSDSYDPGDSDYSVTQVIESPRIVTMTNRYKDQIVYDVDERIMTSLGTHIHTALEQDLPRAYIGCSNSVVSGLADRMDNGVITDIKYTSVFSLQDSNQVEKWKQQLYLYAHLYRGVIEDWVTTGVENFLILWDWMPSKARHDRRYPQSRCMILQHKFDDECFAWASEFMHKRVRTLEWCAKADIRDLPLCTNAEMWLRGNCYAVMKKGRKSAVKLHNTKSYAEAHVKRMGDKHYIEYRDGERMRCISYCKVSKWCDDYQAYLAEHKK